MIHKVDGSNLYVISAYGVWLPGTYDSERAARYAFRFDYETLKAARESAGWLQPITFDLLQQVRCTELGR